MNYKSELTESLLANNLKDPSKTIQMVKVTDLNPEQKKLLLNTICDLINLSNQQCSFKSPTASQKGLVVNFHGGYFGESLELFHNLNKLGLFNYEVFTTEGHSARSAIYYNLITEVNYVSLLKLHQDWHRLSNEIATILARHLSQWCRFEAKGFGLSLKLEERIFFGSPLYNYLFGPLIKQICEISKLGLTYHFNTIVHTTLKDGEIDWEIFEDIVKQAVEDHRLKYHCYEQEHLNKNNISQQKLVQVLGLPEEAVITIKVKDNKDIEIRFSKTYQSHEFIESMRNSLNQQGITIMISDKKLIVPCEERDRFENFINKSDSFCILANLSYALVKKAFHLNQDDFLQLFRDPFYLYIKTESDSQVSLYRRLKQNFINCSLYEKGIIKLPVSEIKEVNLLIRCSLDDKPTKYDLCSYLNLRPEQITINKEEYSICFSSKKACDDFQKSYKDSDLFLTQDISSLQAIKIYYTNALSSFINKQKFALEEKKLEHYLLNDYPESKILRAELSQYKNPPYNRDWLKHKFGEALIDAKEDLFGFNFCLPKENALYSKCKEFLKKLGCGYSIVMDNSFMLVNHAKWHIIFAVECILGKEINTDRIFNYDEKIEKSLIDFLANQKLNNEFKPPFLSVEKCSSIEGRDEASTSQNELEPRLNSFNNLNNPNFLNTQFPEEKRANKKPSNIPTRINYSFFKESLETKINRMSQEETDIPFNLEWLALHLNFDSNSVEEAGFTELFPHNYEITFKKGCENEEEKLYKTLKQLKIGCWHWKFKRAVEINQYSKDKLLSIAENTKKVELNFYKK